MAYFTRPLTLVAYVRNIMSFSENPEGIQRAFYVFHWKRLNFLHFVPFPPLSTCLYELISLVISSSQPILKYEFLLFSLFSVVDFSKGMFEMGGFTTVVGF